MLVAAIPKKQAAYLNFLLFGWSRKLTHPACTSIAPWSTIWDLEGQEEGAATVTWRLMQLPNFTFR
jgi:hypothetical protein